MQELISFLNNKEYEELDTLFKKDCFETFLQKENKQIKEVWLDGYYTGKKYSNSINKYNF